MADKTARRNFAEGLQRPGHAARMRENVSQALRESVMQVSTRVEFRFLRFLPLSLRLLSKMKSLNGIVMLKTYSLSQPVMNSMDVFCLYFQPLFYQHYYTNYTILLLNQLNVQRPRAVCQHSIEHPHWNTLPAYFGIY